MPKDSATQAGADLTVPPHADVPSGPALNLDSPAELPITACRDELIALLKRHRVVVVCGDTGSGKTTQLPKICLAAGFGRRGIIGHTQPRRIAARAVAARLAEEMGAEVGAAVGLKTRFTDRTRRGSVVKVMTDGILLNEIRQDRWLKAYDALIIDEAHERSVNIDFLLGYLARIRDRRPDLRVIITSATMDTARLAAHFDDAPVLNIPGRSFPVEVLYRPPEPDTELPAAVVEAVRELAAMDVDGSGGSRHRDMLVFLPGERWIRDTREALLEARLPDFEVLPLYARLTAQRQDRIFKPGRAPRIVLATNVAETSLTVPRIRFVIDSGLARVSRYSARHRSQGLAVEPIAQANAVQRAGRCGRLAPGICIRLFALEDFERRPDFTDPEILRTNLASVLLRLEALALGSVTDFPFLDPPPERSVNDAWRLLQMLGALDDQRRLTRRGRAMSRLPVDPRLARMLVAGHEGGVLPEMLVMVAAMSVVDPRERPPEAAEAAQREQDKLADPRSDFVTFLNLWHAWQRERRQGRKAARAFCESHFLSMARMREWEDVRSQLAELTRALGWRHEERTKEPDPRSLHVAVLTAFADRVARLGDRREYHGARDARATLFPGTPVSRKPPRWIVAGELMTTQRTWLRTVAAINPRWVMDAAPHLVKREFVEPAWDQKRGCVSAREVLSLFGMVISAEKRVDYGKVAPQRAREVFIRDALAADRLGAEVGFLTHNRALRTQLLSWEARMRSRDLYAGERAVMDFYDRRLPDRVFDRRSLLRWCRVVRGDPLRMTLEDIATRVPGDDEAQLYPLRMEVAGHSLALDYCYDPASERDGVSVTVPQVLLNAVRAEELDWLVPGRLTEKVVTLLRSLPKPLRRSLVPLPDTAASLLPSLEALRGTLPLAVAISKVLRAVAGVQVDADAIAVSGLPGYLRMRVVVVDERGRVLGSGRDLLALQRGLAVPDISSVAQNREGKGGTNRGPERNVRSTWLRSGVTSWKFGDLPDSVPVAQHGQQVRLYPALVDSRHRVDLTLLPPGPAAEQRHRLGTRRLMLAAVPQQCAWVRDRVRSDRALQLSYHGIGDNDALIDDIVGAAADESFAGDMLIRERTRFDEVLQRGRSEFVATAEGMLVLMSAILAAYRTVRQMLAEGHGIGETAREDVEMQLGRLIYPGCLTATPAEWRPHLPRYLRAIAMRLEKLAQRHPKDAEFQARIANASARLDAWQANHPPGWPWPKGVIRYRWLLEEFRVSLFAQSLGTSVPVSEKRLQQYWETQASAESTKT